MKKITFLTIMAAVLIISASMAIGQALYNPWLVESLDSTDPNSGSFDTGIFILNTSASNVSTTYTLYKVGAAGTSTSHAITVPAKDTTHLTFSSLVDTPTAWAGTAVYHIATLSVDNTSGALVGIVARYKASLNPIYSEQLFSWTSGSGTY